MLVAEKLDWLEYSVFYTKVDHSELASERYIHKHVFGDPLIAALCELHDDFKNLNCGLTEEQVILKFLNWAVPCEFHKFFDFSKVRLDNKSINPYRWRFIVGDESDRWFSILVPMKEVDPDQSDFFKVYNLRKDCFETYNAYIGYKIIFSGHNIPVKTVNGNLYPIRFDTFAWNNTLSMFGTCFSLKRVDLAVDVKCHFNQIADLYLNSPLSFKLPFFKKNRELRYNRQTLAGSLNCGVRGAQATTYLRIYNKAAEQGDNWEYYPWDDFDKAVEKISFPATGYPDIYERPWTRFEFELRGLQAIEFLFNYYCSICDDVSPGLYLFDKIGLYQVVSDQEIKYAANGQFDRLYFSVFWNAVITAYNLYCKNSIENFVQFREELESADFSPAQVGQHLALNSTPYRTGIRVFSQIQRALQYFLPAERRYVDDILNDWSRVFVSSADIYEFIKNCDFNFFEDAQKAALKDLAFMCGAAKTKTKDLLNQNSYSRMFKDLVQKYGGTKLLCYDDLELDQSPGIELPADRPISCKDSFLYDS